MSWAKKDYELVARILRDAQREYNATAARIDYEGNAGSSFMLLTIATHFANEFQRDNPRFDRTRFLKACREVFLSQTSD